MNEKIGKLKFFNLDFGDKVIISLFQIVRARAVGGFFLVLLKDAHLAFL